MYNTVMHQLGNEIQRETKASPECSLELCVCLFKHKPAWIMLSARNKQEQ